MLVLKDPALLWSLAIQAKPAHIATKPCKPAQATLVLAKTEHEVMRGGCRAKAWSSTTSAAARRWTKQAVHWILHVCA